MFKDYFKLLLSLMMPYNDKNNMIFPLQLLFILGYLLQRTVSTGYESQEHS